MSTHLSKAVLVAGTLCLSACASTTMRSVQRERDFQSDGIKRVLVVSAASAPALRKLVEEEFVRQWKKRDVDAVASSDVLPPDVSLDKANIAPFAKSQGFDTVLVTRLLSRKAVDRDVHVRPLGGASEKAADEREDPQDMSSYFQAIVASPQYPIAYEVAVLSTNVYSVQSEKRVWSGISQTLVTGDIPKKIRPFTQVILKNIYSNSKEAHP